ncbi:hypothetical protein COX03_00505 [Candidatus Woesebacteria bacterium CG22_combo_CG10-13_8_21_14_all_39_10]|uniref:DUF4446 domain-containing protein n=4 Tax=Candidatus Woeseibacteriota TaxID=1752722 RepID=A0A2M7XAD2_9BACT|nr:MAG: hypothetical protein COX03_00505 [Candidatus Woesebacteria bacterium CG22_combo_CG10-13_8_21_14_all_39_10]PIU71832.1 MAG: hypothetical protein COS80_01090 [Candidatus Woesebacteria bacterium CG06_land_8_20_14_3_00_39_27]PIZ46696.1 MAG: hypothetical protein COY29_06260 [Candidatus Woesebacteria bacterium CG_4_10_14_0_2_um_filter_39_14]PJA43137.1 MAG: hypothetical protein CO176_00050 [Candidatus Woesebacteria bacterium CG_4_9_14_3_um_filter_39_10]
MNVELVLLIIFGIWLAALTIFFIWLFVFFKKLTEGSEKGNLIKVLKKILETQNENSLAIGVLEKEIKRIDWEGKSHVQKVGIIRFNPFKEIGGDHSFSLALLDREDSGVIITCLHTRERTRVYMKGIKKGRSELELSVEEKKALEKAIKE